MFSAEGEFESALRGFERWVEKSTLDGDWWQAALAHSSRAATRLLMNDLDGAAADGEICLQLGNRIQNPIYIASGIAWRSIILLRRGQGSAAYQFAQEAQRMVSEGHNTAVTMIMAALVAWTALCSGHHPEAATAADYSLGQMRRLSPAAPSYHEGYACTLYTAVELASLAQTESEQRTAFRRLRLAIFQMGRFAAVFPIGWPQVFLGIGRYLGMSGQSSAARLAFEAGLRLADRYRLRTEAGLLEQALRTLAETSTDPAKNPNPA